MKTYKDAGVDVQAADAWVSMLGKNLGASTQVVTGIGDYAAIYALNSEQWLAASCDGVGSKLLWAVEGWIKPEDLAQDLLAMNFNDLLCVGAQPIFFLDYLAVGSKKLLQKEGILDRFVRALGEKSLSVGACVVGGETAQMPELYKEAEWDCAGFAVGTLKPSERLGVENISPGSELWAWPSSGPHSNGYTWLRKLFSKSSDSEQIQKYFSAPTCLYVKEFLELRGILQREGVSDAWEAAYHITGSGWLNLLRAQPLGRKIGFHLDSFPEIPKWAEEIKKRAECEDSLLYSTFNMGWGFTVVLNRQKLKGVNPEKLGLRRLGYVVEEACVRFKNFQLE